MEYKGYIEYDESEKRRKKNNVSLLNNSFVGQTAPSVLYFFSFTARQPINKKKYSG